MRIHQKGTGQNDRSRSCDVEAMLTWIGKQRTEPTETDDHLRREKQIFKTSFSLKTELCHTIQKVNSS